MLTLMSSMMMSALGLWLGFGALAALIYRSIGRRLQAIDPAQASLLLLAWMTLPLFAALLTTYVLYSPDVAQWLVVGHCHANTCSQHGPQSSLAIIPMALLVMWTAYRLCSCVIRQWLPAQRLYQQLYHMGDDTGEFMRLGTTAPIAFTLGGLRPKVFISAGMLSACSSEDIDCILRHEHAHRERHDNLRIMVGRFLIAPFPRRWSEPLLHDLKLCCEMACDMRAAADSSRDKVAAALLRVARVQQQAAPSGSLAFAGNATEQRILALLNAPLSPLANELVFATVTGTLLIVLVLINPLHRAIELIP
ncbi:MAG: M56 family metallopeptidase [Halioglobus sp.]